MQRQFSTSSIVLLLLTAGCPSDPEPAEGETSTETGDTDPSSGDGDGDPSSGDGDGDPSSGDGDGDPSTTGDGDGDPSTTGDGDGDPSTTGDGDGDPSTGDGDGDPEGCDPAAFVGGGIGGDGWGVGDYCDDLFACVDADLAAALVDLGLVGCSGPGENNLCPAEMVGCDYGAGVVDQALVDLVCASLELGVDEATCWVWGP